MAAKSLEIFHRQIVGRSSPNTANTKTQTILSGRGRSNSLGLFNLVSCLRRFEVRWIDRDHLPYDSASVSTGQGHRLCIGGDRRGTIKLEPSLPWSRPRRFRPAASRRHLSKRRGAESDTLGRCARSHGQLVTSAHAFGSDADTTDCRRIGNARWLRYL
jgi:hypothetical protein